MKRKKILLIDGNAIIHRAFHALPPLSTKKGQLVNAVYGFTSTLLNVIKEFNPDYIAASFDLAGPTFRHEEYKEYKATRKKAPDELYTQIPLVKKVVEAFNIPIYEKQGFEADDVIGTLVKIVEKEHKDVENIIVTGDLDALQLVSPQTQVFTMRRGLKDSVLYDEKAVKERFGFSADKLAEYKGMAGDSSDNIPGVKGIGAKSATELIQEYGNLENIYKNLNKLKKSWKDKLSAEKEQAFLSRQLGTIKTDVELDFDLESCQTKDFDREKVVELFKEFSFFSLINRVKSQGDHAVGAAIENKNSKTPVLNCSQVKSADMDKFVKILNKQKEIIIDISLNKDKEGEEELIKGLSFCWKKGPAYSSGKQAYFIDNEEDNLAKLKPVLEDKKIKKVGYDLKVAYKLLKKQEIKLEGIHFDIFLAAYLLDPGSNLEIETLIFKELGEEVDFQVARQRKLDLGLELEDPSLSQEEVKRACQKVNYIRKLKNIFEKKMNAVTKEQQKKGGSKTINDLFYEMEIPQVEILAEMEIAGVKIDTQMLNQIFQKLKTEINKLEKKIHDVAGKDFNVNSTQQLREVLFTDLKLPTEDIKKTKTGFSTAVSELEKLRDKHPIIAKIEKYRELFKLKTTYLGPLPQLVNTDSRLHTTFHQTGTATGRLSSSDPNLQNIPIQGDLAQEIRKAFIAEKGWKLISADYSQIDLRVVAHLSQDKKLMEAFNKDADIHTLTASQVYKIPLEKVDKKMRSNAKALNFSIIYGAGPYGFSQYAGISREEAKDFIDKYFEKFIGIRDYIQKTKEKARQDEYIETLEGRRRFVPEINSPNFQIAGAAERIAINMPVQGLSADIMKIAMIKVYDHFQDNKDVKLILQVHDEIILEVKEKIAHKVANKVKEIMQDSYKLSVPLKVDAQVGSNWGEI